MNDNFFGELPEGISFSNSVIENLYEEMKLGVNLSWQMVADGIISGDSFLNFDPETIARTFEGIFKTFAYSLCILFFGINLIEKTITYELFSFKGGCKLVGGLIVAKVWIDLSYKVCGWIIEINNNFVHSILSDSVQSLSVPNQALEFTPSSIPIIGWFIDLFRQLFASIPLFIICLIMFIASTVIIIKLVIRIVELTLSVIVSPVFFACMLGEPTRRYFQNFLVSFLTIVTQTLFMAVVYGLASHWWTGICNQNPDAYFAYILPNTVMLCGFAYMMCKPPKVLTDMIR